VDFEELLPAAKRDALARNYLQGFRERNVASRIARPSPAGEAGINKQQAVSRRDPARHIPGFAIFTNR
jgi:hypothetical protein